MAVHELREHDALGMILKLLRHFQHYPPGGSAHASSEVELLMVALDTLAQMCMDDECAAALRIQHSDGFMAVGVLLLDDPWRCQGNHGATASIGRAFQLGPSSCRPLQCNVLPRGFFASCLRWSGTGRLSNTSFPLKC